MVAAKFFSAKNIAYFGVLLALVIVLQTFGGTLTIGPVQLNFTLVPIVVGAILLGPVAGALLGLACGIVVLIQVILMMSPFYAVIWTEAPVITTLVCTVKTTVAGLAAGLLYRLIAKKSTLAAVFAASAVVPILNTGIFILGCLCMNGAIAAFQTQLDLGGMNVFVFIVVILVTWNFFIEFAINLLLSPAIHRVVTVTEKYIMKKYSAKREPAVEAAAAPDGKQS